ncbi:MAG TPA: hypothetical protein VD932_02590 [Aquabacterium sp.]|nr:hypothetical protein [Aquabacterium sp.]
MNETLLALATELEHEVAIPEGAQAAPGLLELAKIANELVAAVRNRDWKAGLRLAHKVLGYVVEMLAPETPPPVDGGGEVAFALFGGGLGLKILGIVAKILLELGRGDQ